MKINRFIVIAVLFLLVSGWVFFQVIHPENSLDVARTDFRSWFWEYRALDLIVLVVLVLAGAFGIAAILPVEENDD
ncbi:MAG: hypothetical protein ACOCYU_03560 [Brevefilum sp.]